MTQKSTLQKLISTIHWVIFRAHITVYDNFAEQYFSLIKNMGYKVRQRNRP